MAGDYQGKTVYVVGGSQGVGLACAEAFAKAGARLVLFARGAEGSRAGPWPRGRLRARGLLPRSGRHGPRGRRAGHEGGRPCKAVHPTFFSTASEAARPDYFEKIDAARLQETLSWNLLACWHPVSALLPGMKERGGIIVNTASLAGLVGVFGYTDYSAAKFAVVGFSEALRSELKPHGVRVCVLCPPDTDTPGFAEEEKGKPLETRAVSSGGSLLSPEEVARSLLAGLARESFLIIPGRAARWVVRARRFFPGWVDWFTDRVVARAQK